MNDSGVVADVLIGSAMSISSALYDGCAKCLLYLILPLLALGISSRSSASSSSSSSLARVYSVRCGCELAARFEGFGRENWIFMMLIGL